MGREAVHVPKPGQHLRRRLFDLLGLALVIGVGAALGLAGIGRRRHAVDGPDEYGGVPAIDRLKSKPVCSVFIRHLSHFSSKVTMLLL